MSEQSLAILHAVQWLSQPPSSLPVALLDWLMEKGSMTQRLEQHCSRVSVRLCREGYVAPPSLGDECEQLPASERYWLREVVLYGDETPWLFGRTLVPSQTLSGAQRALTEIGSVPLGRYLFNKRSPERDYIHIGSHGGLWARRSRLRLSGNPLLLTELFLPEAPVYAAADRTDKSAF
ncbi:chorismate lyase [Affinibrenneria salicis]|uniref:Chorismate pyruvate-lyase n=1 Tax=Affinibrenneria salicis TaxID=2590031 RepID=A0A5J5G7L5_9GAMM|nr:chorismate lyase [Affinibrenneria salicis]KAA9003307.1 chorismate lyase [Affinibrenneria salicis]KAA9003310.1 chorismate lyase [Affinibrenneria salicis]